MRVLVAPQEFKGSLTAKEAAKAIAAGVAAAARGAELDLLPMADGGPGTLEALVEATDGVYEEMEVHDPLMRRRRARWARLGSVAQETAVIEMAEASGLVLLRPEERDPRRTTTFGTGELLAATLDAGYRRIVVGVGGSATNDGGVGMALALGVQFRDERGDELPPGGADLSRLARIDMSGMDPRVREAEIVIAADVTNPLCGSDGASYVYGPQKGADESMAAELDASLEHYSAVVREQLGVDVADAPGAGAAGGLGYGLMVFCGAIVQPGFDVVAAAAGLEARVMKADLVITGEGRLDRQSGFGKTTSGVSRVCRQHRKPVVAVVGSVADEVARAGFDGVFALGEGTGTVNSMRDARELLEDASADAVRELLRSGLLW